MSEQDYIDKLLKIKRNRHQWDNNFKTISLPVTSQRAPQMRVPVEKEPRSLVIPLDTINYRHTRNNSYMTYYNNLLLQ